MLDHIYTTHMSLKSRKAISSDETSRVIAKLILKPDQYWAVVEISDPFIDIDGIRRRNNRRNTRIADAGSRLLIRRRKSDNHAFRTRRPDGGSYRNGSAELPPSKAK